MKKIVAAVAASVIAALPLAAAVGPATAAAHRANPRIRATVLNEACTPEGNTLVRIRLVNRSARTAPFVIHSIERDVDGTTVYTTKWEPVGAHSRYVERLPLQANGRMRVSVVLRREVLVNRGFTAADCIA